MAMDIHVYDTYVKAKDGHTMHFDVITDKQDHDQAIAFAKEWLATVGEEGATRNRRGMSILSHTRCPRTSRKLRLKKKVISSKRWKAVNSIIFFYYFSFF